MNEWARGVLYAKQDNRRDRNGRYLSRDAHFGHNNRKVIRALCLGLRPMDGRTITTSESRGRHIIFNVLRAITIDALHSEYLRLLSITAEPSPTSVKTQVRLLYEKIRHKLTSTIINQ